MAVNRITAPHEQLFVKALVKACQKYYRDPDNVKKFKDWYLKKYGVPYKQMN